MKIPNDRVVLVRGDCLAGLRRLPGACVDAIVTDPPAGISFMGKTWDRPGVLGVSGGAAMPATTASRNPSCRTCGGRKRAGPATKACECAEPDWNDVELRLKDREAFVGFLADVMRECLRVLKPGGHALVWALPRTSGWTSTAIENAGFELRDCVYHLFGSGFPKSLDVSKAIDKALGAEPEVIGHVGSTAAQTVDRVALDYGGATGKAKNGLKDGYAITAPATEEAKRWAGWGTALKPAVEVWWLARKSLDGTVAANVLAHGTGALNIDACRVAYQSSADREASRPASLPKANDSIGTFQMRDRSGEDPESRQSSLGRFPPHVLLSHAPECVEVGTRKVKGDPRGDCGGRRPGGFVDTGSDSGTAKPNAPVYGDSEIQLYACIPGCPVRALDGQTGVLTSGKGAKIKASAKGYRPNALGAESRPVGTEVVSYADSGGGSRFFPNLTADPLDDLDAPFRYFPKPPRREKDAGLDHLPAQSGGEATERADDSAGTESPRAGAGRTGGARNVHPTVKGVALMRWLCRLITPPGGLVLDPFAGSGSTGVAAIAEGFRFFGIERDAQYFEIAKARIAHAMRVADEGGAAPAKSQSEFGF